MNSRAGYHGMDGESLQADVMRFMAIIAFCLIAILALVRNVEAPPTPPTTPLTTPPTLSRTPVTEAPELRDVPQAPQTTRIFDPIEPPAEPNPLPTPKPLTSVPDKPVALADVVAPATSPPSVPQTEQAPEGLILRFVSDGDFLRLIAKGDVRVYAFQDRQVLLLGEDYLVHDAAAPGKVYEVLPETIPGLIDSALNKRTPDAQSFTWAISLPQRIERQIQGYLASVTTGQLLINRFGKVDHVTTR